MHTDLKHIDHIIDGCKKEDRKAQKQLYLYFYDAMMNLCLRYTKNETDAEHVLNVGFLRVFKNIDQFDPSKAGIYSWIHKIVTNCCLYYLKQKQNAVATKELDEAYSLHIQPDVFAKMNDGEILNLVRSLPEATQAVFNLHVIDGYAHKEIAELLQISEGTSKWHLSDARRKLKIILLQKSNNI